MRPTAARRLKELGYDVLHGVTPLSADAGRGVEIEGRIQGEAGKYVGHAAPRLFGHSVVKLVLRLADRAVRAGRRPYRGKHGRDDFGDLDHLGLTHAQRGHRWRADSQAAGVPRAVRV